MKIGDFVRYVFPTGHENGRIKSFHPTSNEPFVVYHCNDDWDNYMSYTGELTPHYNLRAGWLDAEGKPLSTPKTKEES